LDWVSQELDVELQLLPLNVFVAFAKDMLYLFEGTLLDEVTSAVVLGSHLEVAPLLVNHFEAPDDRSRHPNNPSGLLVDFISVLHLANLYESNGADFV